MGRKIMDFLKQHITYSNMFLLCMIIIIMQNFVLITTTNELHKNIDEELPWLSHYIRTIGNSYDQNQTNNIQESLTKITEAFIDEDGVTISENLQTIIRELKKD